MDLLAQIEREGAQEAERVTAEAETEAQGRLARAEQEIAAEVEAYRQGERHRMEQEQRLIVSRARAQARAIFLRAKSRVAEELFERLVEDTANVRGDAARYRTFLQRCLREAEQEVRASLVLHADTADQSVITELIQGTGHRLGEAIKTLGGFIATDAGGQLVVDNRLETRIANLRQRARAEVGKALFVGAASTSP